MNTIGKRKGVNDDHVPRLIGLISKLKKESNRAVERYVLFHMR